MPHRCLGALTVLFASSAAAAPFAYIPNYDDDTVSVIDLASHEVVDTIPVGDKPASVAVVGPVVYVVCRGAERLDVINTNTRAVFATVGLCLPKHIAANVDGTELLVSSACGERVDEGRYYSIVYRVSTGNHAITQERMHYYATGFPLYDNFRPTDKGVAYSLGGTRFAAVNSEIDKLTVRSVNTIFATDVSVGDGPHEIVRVDGSEPRFYVTNRGSDSISVVDGGLTEELLSINVGDNPHGLAASPDGQRLYVANRNDDTLSVIDLGSNNVIDTIPVGSQPLGVAVHPLSTFVYVAASESNIVSVIDAATLEVVDNILVGDRPIAYGNFVSTQAGVQATPSSHYFASTAVGQSSASQTFEIRNVGSEDLLTGTVLLVGDDDDHFEVMNTTCVSGGTLAPQGTCAITVRFAPQDFGGRSAQVQMFTNDPETPDFRMHLFGIGLGPDIDIHNATDPSTSLTILMDSVTVGEIGLKTVGVRNAGNSNLHLGTVGGVDGLASPFALTTDCSGTILAPQESCDLNLRFDPSAAGTVSDTFDLPSDDPNEPSITVTVQGRGVNEPVGNLVADDTIEPPLDGFLDFGDVDVAATAAAELLLFNRGSALALEVSEVRVEGANADQFALDFEPDVEPCGVAPITVPGPTNPMHPPYLQPHPCHIGVAFSPTQAGIALARVVIVSNTSSGEDFVFDLSGRAIGPEIDVVSALDLGEVPVGLHGVDEIDIANLGTSPLAVSNLRLVGSQDLTLELDGGLAPCGAADFSLPAGQVCTISVSFTPSDEGEQTGAVLLESDDPDETNVVVDLIATGGPALPLPDAGGDAGPGDADGGCACDASTDPIGVLALAGLLLLGLVRRRRD